MKVKERLLKINDNALKRMCIPTSSQKNVPFSEDFACFIMYAATSVMLHFVIFPIRLTKGLINFIKTVSDLIRY